MHIVAAKFVPCLLTDEQQANRVSQSVRTWWKLSEKFHNRWWNMGIWVWYRSKSSVVAVDGKIVATCKKKSMLDSIRCEDVDQFFMGRALFIMSLFHMVSQSKESFTWMLWTLWGRKIKGRGLIVGETRPGCCTITTHLLTRCYLSMNCWRSERWLVYADCHTLQIWPLWTLFCSWGRNPLCAIPDFGG
jgi:hypothetical protein